MATYYTSNQYTPDRVLSTIDKTQHNTREETEPKAKKVI